MNFEDRLEEISGLISDGGAQFYPQREGWIERNASEQRQFTQLHLNCIRDLVAIASHYKEINRRQEEELQRWIELNSQNY